MIAKDISNIVISALIEEVKLQGHVDTGALVRSFDSNEIEKPNSLTIEILFYDYGMFLNYGRRAGTYVPFEILFDWVKRKLALSGDDASSATFAINRKIFEEGIPTSGAKRYSATGKRTEFIDDALKRKDKEVTEAVGKYFETVIGTRVEKATKVGIYQY